jgi:hypothetical protein
LRVLIPAQPPSGAVDTARGPVAGHSHLKRCVDNYPECRRSRNCPGVVVT